VRKISECYIKEKISKNWFKEEGCLFCNDNSLIVLKLKNDLELYNNKGIISILEQGTFNVKRLK